MLLVIFLLLLAQTPSRSDNFRLSL